LLFHKQLILVKYAIRNVIKLALKHGIKLSFEGDIL
jgi:hypothetical protein